MLHGKTDNQSWDQRISILDSDDPPEVVTEVPTIKQDVFAMRTLMTSKVPVRRFTRDFFWVVNYGFGDSSWTSFGSSWITGNDALKFRHGVWVSDKECCSYVFYIIELKAQP